MQAMSASQLLQEQHNEFPKKDLKEFQSNLSKNNL